MSRPQVGIERLPTNRPSNEPRGSMNCKSCRKRKIKCNRLRPTCEACQVFQCACIYDAVPKKRGPKRDVLEALLKRVDGLEQKLKHQKNDGDDSEADEGNEVPETEPGGGRGGISPGSEDSAPGAGLVATSASGESSTSPNSIGPNATTVDSTALEPPRRQPNPKLKSNDLHVPATIPEDESTYFAPHQVDQEQTPPVQIDALLHTYFTRSHAKPFHILDEASFRQRLQLGQIPSYLLGSVCALSSRYTPHPNGYQAGVKLGEDYARQARSEIDSDEPSIDCLQALLLLALAFVASGKGKKAYMLLSNAIGMAVALELHREMDASARVLPVEREMRRRLFWTCYLLDRFMACGSRRPSLISDSTVLLRLPSWFSASTSMPIEGDFFQSASNLQYLQGGGGKKLQGGSGMLIDISRILGITNRYLAAGGVKGDSHFPWHSLSNLSKIRQDLDTWASGAQDIFSSVATLFSQPDSTVLVMSKLIYHLIHCLIYRPFLPVDLAELSGTGQHQSWQIEATNMCFLHANAIAELTELGKRMPQIEWPGFVGYCICTAGTVHVHGAHYNKTAAGSEMSVFATSAEFLSRELQHLSEMRHAWACVQHHRETLQSIYNAHSELVKSINSSRTRYSPVFQLDDFFDRYSNIGGPGGLSFNFDASNLILADVVVDFIPDSCAGDGSGVAREAEHGAYHNKTASNNAGDGGNSGAGNDALLDAAIPERMNLKRKKTVSSTTKPLANSSESLQTSHSLPPSSLRQSVSYPVDTSGTFSAQSTRTAHMQSVNATRSPSMPIINDNTNSGGDSDLQSSMSDTPGYDIGSHLVLQQQQQQQQHHHQQQQQQQMLTTTASFSPIFSFSTPLVGHAATVAGSAGGLSATLSGTNNNNNNGHVHIELSGYDPMFATTIPTNAFSSPSPWPAGDDANGGAGAASATSGGGTQSLTAGMASLQHQSPDGRSNDGSTGGGLPGGGEEKDPFLSLLEQLADNEYARGPGSELDFFLAGTSGSV